MSGATRFGLHMGNSTISLSILKEEKIEIVASKFGDRSSYACLAAAADNEFVIGLPAKQGIARNESLTVVNNFQFLNEDLTENELATAISQTCLCKLNTKPLEYHLEKGDDISATITPYEVAVKFLQNAHENAAHAGTLDNTLEVVLSVPIHWSAKSRERYCKAANEAGFDVLQVLTEPSAALLANDVGADLNESSNVLVVRLGGLSSDITVFSVTNGMYAVVDNLHLPHLGGNVLTKTLSDYLAQEFFNKYKLDPRESRRTMVKLQQHAETCKHVLSTMPSAHVFIESLMDGLDWSQNISRARFENVIQPKIASFVRPIEEVVNKHSITIEKIIFTGGTMKIPKLQSAISALFPGAQVCSTIPADEVIAIGCAKQASYINGDGWDATGTYVDMEITTLSKDIYVADAIKSQDEDSKEVLLKKGALVPSIHGVNLARPIKSIDGAAKLRVVQGDRESVIERAVDTDLIEIRARLHGGIQLSDDNKTSSIEQPSIHLHLH